MKDQDSNHFRVLSFRNNMIKKIPLQLIIGMCLHGSLSTAYKLNVI